MHDRGNPIRRGPGFQTDHHSADDNLGPNHGARVFTPGLRPARRLETGTAVIAALLSGFAAGPWMRAALRYGSIVLAVLLFLLSLRRSGERAGRLAERLATAEKANDVQRQMLEAAARRPRDRNELAQRLRDGRF